MNSFPIVFQHDTMLCGVTCLQMVCEDYKRKYTGNYLSSLCHATPEGVSLLGLRETAVQLGFDCECGRISIDCMESLDMPCILHWNQNHFVVLYKVKKGRKFYIADPGKGLVKYNRKVTSNDSVELLVPYKYLYLFDEPRTARISVEGQDKDAMPCMCRINYYSRNLIVVEGKHYFRATASIRSSGFSAQPGLDVFARIVVSDKTLWQQVFR